MNNDSLRQLCMDLLLANTEDRVIELLKERGYWDQSECWRYFGDKGDNYPIIGTQQSRPEAALVEKIVNSVDARLMNECQIRGIHPESPEAPQSIALAVSKFFVNESAPSEMTGSILTWGVEQRRQVANGISLAATGAKTNPCFTIADIGEGQSAKRMPDTLLSLDKQNKRRVHFVQGTFNMGGTGVLRFCGHENLQLLISRRNPLVVSQMCEQDDTAGDWAFTVVRRENPSSAEKTSTYTYLAPNKSEYHPRKGGVLHFSAVQLPLMPEKNEAYVRNVEWGTAIKLYEYGLRKGARSQIVRPDGLLYSLELLLPEIALPVRLHECRAFGGDPKRSFDTNLNGLIVRLEDGRHDNVEDGFPDTVQFSLESGEKFSARIYAFRKGKAKTYRKSEGIVFVVNGQTHANMPKTFFDRRKVKMGRLADSILIVVDCSTISGRSHEDLFMNSRDRLSGGELRLQLEEELEDLVRNHTGLRALRERRHKEETEKNLADSKPLEEVLKSILKSSPTLSSLFLTGQRLSNPYSTIEVETGEDEYQGKPHPTFFKFKKVDYGRVFKRNCPVNQRCRIAFETDVANDYFRRAINPGRFILIAEDEGERAINAASNVHLHNGKATLNIKFPEGTHVGQRMMVTTTVEDDTLMAPFENVAEIVLEEAKEVGPGGTGKRKPPADRDGDKAEKTQGIELPKPVLVRQKDWEEHGFDEKSGCKVVQDESTDDPDRLFYTYYVNVDNIYLRTEQKASKRDASLLRARFIYGMVLISLAMIKDAVESHNGNASSNQDNEDTSDEAENLPARVLQVTRAVGPFLLPLIESLGGLREEDTALPSEIGDDE